MLNYACQKGVPALRSPDETTPTCTAPTFTQPYIRQITSGPGDADNPSVSADGVIAFDADGTFDGGGRGNNRRQIFLWVEGGPHPFKRITDESDGDSTHATLNWGGGKLAFETTIGLLGPGGTKQIYLYNRDHETLEAVTHGNADSTQPMLNKVGTLLAFQSFANLLGDGAATPNSQIFLYDKNQSDIDPGSLRQLTNGNGPSRNPYMEEKNPSRVYFDSTASDLPGTFFGPGRQVYAAPTHDGDLPTIEQVTVGYGNCKYPAVDSGGDRVVFICDGDPLQNGTSGNRLFALHYASLSRTLYQITGRGNVDGPIAASVPWFVTLATNNDMAGTGNCGTNIYIADYWPSHYNEPGHSRLAVSSQFAVPVEPSPAGSSAGCDDGNACTTDTCQGGQSCTHGNVQDGLTCGTGNVCTGIKACAAGHCQQQPGLVCDDHDPCTQNSCVQTNPPATACQFPPLLPTNAGVQCHQAQIGTFQLQGRTARVQGRLASAITQAISRPKAAARMKAARKARKLAERLASVAADDSSVDQSALLGLLDELRKLVETLSRLLAALSAELGK